MKVEIMGMGDIILSLFFLIIIGSVMCVCCFVLIFIFLDTFVHLTHFIADKRRDIIRKIEVRKELRKEKDER